MSVVFLSDYDEHRATFGDKPIEYVLVGVPFILWWHFAVRFDHLWIENDNIIHQQGILSKDSRV